MTEPIVLTPIGLVRGGRSQIFEDHWGAVVSRLVLDAAVLDPAATDGLSEFSHIEVVFHFHQETRVRRGASHPRGNPAWPPVGVTGAFHSRPAPIPYQRRIRSGQFFPGTNSVGTILIVR